MYNASNYRLSKTFTGMIALGCAGFFTVTNAQFVSEEIVYDNILGPVTGQYPTTAEYGDELTLASDGRKITRFDFEYLGQFEPNGDETCVVRFYANDGEKVLQSSSPGTLLYESEPFTIFPDFNTATIDKLAVEVPDVFTYTVEFEGLSGRSTDRASLLLRDPVLIGKSFDDFWVNLANGWTPWRFNGDPIANFACRVTAEVDFSVKFKNLKGKSGQAPELTIGGPRNQSAIVYSSSDKKTWRPIAIQEFKNKEFTIIDEGAQPGSPRYYRTSIISNTPINLQNFQILPDSKSRMGITGPRGLPFKVQASDDFETWSDVFSLSFQTRPITIQDDHAIGKKRRFYRILLNDTVIEDVSTIEESIVTYPDDFTLED